MSFMEFVVLVEVVSYNIWTAFSLENPFQISQTLISQKNVKFHKLSSQKTVID